MSEQDLAREFIVLRSQIKNRFMKYCSSRVRDNPRQCLKLYNDMKYFFLELKKKDDPEYIRLYVKNLIPIMQFVLLKRERNTFKTYFKILWRYAKYLIREKKNIFDIDMDVLSKYFTVELNAEYKESNTLYLINDVLRIFYNFYDRKSIVEKLRSFKFKRQAKFKVDLTDEEYDKIYQSIDDLRVKLALELIAGSGLRPGEALGITWGDVKEGGDMWRVEVRYIPDSQYGAKGENSERVVPMTKRATELIQYLRKIYIQKYASDPMKTDKGGRIINISYKTLNRKFKKAAKKTGIRKRYPLTLHKLRHYFAHRWMKNVRDVMSLKEILGHNDLNSTIIYANPTEEEILESFREVDRE